MTTAATPARRRRLEPEDRRRQILGCAVRLFGDLGYDAVSADDIAAAAGVTRGLVNHYFGTKKDLYLEVVRVLATVPEDAVPPDAGGDLAARADAAVGWFLDAVSRFAKTWLVAVASSGPSRSSEVAEVVAQADEVTVDRLLRLAGVEPRHDLDEERVRAVLRCYVHFARAGAVEWLVRGALSREQAHALLSTTLVALIEGTLPRLAGGAGPGPAAG